MPIAATGSTVSISDLEIPKRARKFYKKGMLALQQHRWSDTKQGFARTIEKFPDFARSYNGLGVALAESGEAAAATEAFRRALKIQSNFGEAYLNLTRILIREHQHFEAESVSTILVDCASGNATSFMNLVIAEFEQRKFDDVVSNVERIHANAKPHKPRVHAYAAKSYLAKGMNAEAETNLRFCAAKQASQPI